MSKQGSRGRLGFTLLEVMVAVALLSIALVAILKANVENLTALTESREMTTATLLAASKLAEVEAVGADRWTEFQGDFGEEYPDFTWEVENEPADLEGLRRVAVTVRRGETGENRSVRIEELLYIQ
jgi:general secretion pathway protein I